MKKSANIHVDGQNNARYDTMKKSTKIEGENHARNDIMKKSTKIEGQIRKK